MGENIIFKTKGVIILGGGITSRGNLSQESHERVLIGVKFFKNNRSQYLILSGNGSWRKKIPLSRTESYLMAEVALKKGIDKAVIRQDTRSLDTIGNAYFTKELIRKNQLGKSFLIVTSDYHLKRTKWLFNLVFGKKYKLTFLGVNPKLSPKIHKQKEQRDLKILKYTRRLFIDKKIKTEKGVQGFIFSHHPFYISPKKRGKILKEQEKKYGINFIDI